MPLAGGLRHRRQSVGRVRFRTDVPPRPRFFRTPSHVSVVADGLTQEEQRGLQQLTQRGLADDPVRGFVTALIRPQSRNLNTQNARAMRGSQSVEPFTMGSDGSVMVTTSDAADMPDWAVQMPMYGAAPWARQNHMNMAHEETVRRNMVQAHTLRAPITGHTGNPAQERVDIPPASGPFRRTDVADPSAMRSESTLPHVSAHPEQTVSIDTPAARSIRTVIRSVASPVAYEEPSRSAVGWEHLDPGGCIGSIHKTTSSIDEAHSPPSPFQVFPGHGNGC